MKADCFTCKRKHECYTKEFINRMPKPFWSDCGLDDQPTDFRYLCMIKELYDAYDLLTCSKYPVNNISSEEQDELYYGYLYKLESISDEYGLSKDEIYKQFNIAKHLWHEYNTI